MSNPKQARERPFAMNLTTRAAAVAALRAHYMPELMGLEDFESFEALVASGGKSLLAGMAASCLEDFDESLRRSMPKGWSAHCRAKRGLATLVGPIEFRRTVFVDEFGRRRALLDELLSIPPRSRLSPGAFLWLVGRAAEESYRKTAAAFFAETGCRVSHVAVMGCVRRAAELLRHREPPASGRISQPALFLEVDGLWVHLQSHEHREHALPRFLYEQARRAASFELKLAALYAGKRPVAPGRYERGGLRLTCADLPPQGFWDEAWAMLSAEYDPGDLEELWVGADGGKWCGPERISEMVPESCLVRGSLDPFHIMQKICRAFPEGARREWAAGLARRGRPLQLARMCDRVLPKIKDAKRRDKVRDLRKYMLNNAGSAVFPKESMGTMEGTNAHVGAARMKGRGMSWSRKGAEAMCLVRCALAEGRPLRAPKYPALFTKKEERAAEKFLAKRLSRGPGSCGSGWAPPHQASTWAMKSNVRFRARTC